jgi:hypothetical protein
MVGCRSRTVSPLRKGCGASVDPTGPERLALWMADTRNGGSCRSGHHSGAALDLTGSGVTKELIELTGEPAGVLSIADFTAAEHGAQVSVTAANHATAYTEAARLFSEGALRIPVAQRFRLAEASDAQIASASGHIAGRTVITVRQARASWCLIHHSGHGSTSCGRAGRPRLRVGQGRWSGPTWQTTSRPTRPPTRSRKNPS